MEAESRKFYLDEFLSEECQCGRAKQKRRSFCYRCYKALPDHMQKELWLNMGNGYEEAYDAACKYLNA